jgi:drug/metabolite transporter (DMT)-like permease
MSRQLEFIVLNALVAVSAVAGALISRYIQKGGNLLWYYVPGLFTVGLWAVIVRRSPYNMLVSSVVWDVAYEASWILMLVFVTRDATTKWQAIGAVIVIVGCCVMGIEGKE